MSTTESRERLISSDSHVTVTHDAVKSRLASKFHEDYDKAVEKMGGGGVAMRQMQNTMPKGFEGVRHAIGRQGNWDPVERLKAYEGQLFDFMDKNEPPQNLMLVMGPWNHGGWGGRGRKLQNVDFGSDTGRYFRSEILAPFFAYHLKGKGTLKLPEASIFRSGTNKWMAYDTWNPKGSFEQRGIYLHASGKLSFEKPTDKTEAFDSYVSDPANPVPYRKRPILPTYGPGSTWYTWLADDQSFVADRKDVLIWKSDNLTEDVTITGDIIADLYASTSGTDSDWIVKLIDLYPSDDPKLANYELMVADEIFRGRYLKSFEKAEPLTPNAVNKFAIDLRGNDHTFKKGHRIMVEVQSTWFPLYNRNPQKFVPNILKAEPGDYQSATQKIYRSAKFPSHINVNVAR